MSDYPRRRIGEVAEVFVGLARKGKVLSGDEPGHLCRLIGMKAVREPWIDFEAVETVHLAAGIDPEPYRLMENDILVPCRASSFRVILAGRQSAGMLIDSNILAIRCGEALLPEVLVAFLRHPRGQSALEMASQSTTKQKNLTVKAVRRMVCPIPPLAVQRRAAELLQAAERVHHLAVDCAEKRLVIAQQIAVNHLFE